MKTRPKNLPATLSTADRALLAAVAAYFTAMHIGALLKAGDGPMWGLTFAAYQWPSFPAAAALALPILAMLLPPLKLRVPAPAIVLGMAAAFALLAAFCQAAYPLYGDGALYMTEIARIVQHPAEPSSLVKPTSFLTGIVIQAYTAATTPADLRAPYRVLGIAAVAVMLVFFYRIIRRDRAAIAPILLLCGGSGLVFALGYVELYLFQYLAALLFFVAADRAARGQGRAATSSAALAVSMAFGLSSAVFIPAALFLLLRPRLATDRSRRNAVVALAAAPFAAAALMAFAPASWPLRDAFLSFGGGAAAGSGGAAYALLSARHLLDVASVLLLNTGPVAAAALVATAVALARARGLFREPAVQFALIALAGGLCLVLCGNAAFGWLRDWDLAATPSLALLYYTSAVVAQLLRRSVLRFRRTAGILAVAAGCHALLWVLHNADGDAAFARASDALRTYAGAVSPENTYNGMLNLWKYAVNRQDAARALALERDMIRLGVNLRDSYEKYYKEVTHIAVPAARERELRALAGMILADATAPATSAAARERDYLAQLAARVLVHAAQQGHTALYAEYARAFAASLADWREEGLLRAVADDAMPQEQRLALMERAMTRSYRDPLLLDLLGQLYALAGRDDRAIAVFDEALAIDSTNYPSIYVDLMNALRRAGDRERFAAAGRRLVRNCPDSPETRALGR